MFKVSKKPEEISTEEFLKVFDKNAPREVKNKLKKFIKKYGKVKEDKTKI